MLKRKLAPEKSEVFKKRKKKGTENSFVNGNINLKEEDTSKQIEDTSKQIEDLNGKSLRESFNSANGLDALKRFVKLCNEDKEKDLVVEYLSAGGNILEILKLLDNSDKKGIGTVATVFSAVRILLMKILTECPQYQMTAEGACRHLINSHLSLIHSMMSVQSNAKQQKTVLQLLAAIVSLGGNLPRELLSHVDLPLEIVRSLVQHTKPTDDQCTRYSFIHFVLAFLVEGNASIVRALLYKRDLLCSIFPDLLYDSKDIIALVLSTLKTYILQNSSISKTMKLQIFSISVIQNLVCLYNWKGPYNWSKFNHESTVLNPRYLEEKEIVTEIVHDFLIILLTSHRCGIIFHDRMLGTSHVKHNHIVNTILKSLDRPWEHEKPSNLVIKIMTACPDLIKSQFLLLEPYIEPRVSSKWMAAIKFVREIIQSVEVENCTKISLLELNTTKSASAIASLILPGIILKQSIMPSLSHSSIIIQHEAVLTLISMLNQTQKYLLVLKKICKEDSDFQTLKNCITEYILRNMPNLNAILKVWSCAFTSDSVEDSSTNDKDSISEPKKYEHLTVVLNLLNMYNEVCPKLLDTLPNMQADAFLSVLDKLDSTSVDEFNAIKVKAIKFLVMLYPNEFLPHKKIFKHALSFLLSILNEKTSSTALYTEETIKTLLHVTGLFEGCNDHLDNWINAFIKLNDRKKVIKWFIRAIKETAQDIEKYVDEIIKVEEIVNEDVIHSDRLENLFDELMNKPSICENLESNILPMQRFASISPLLCCMLHGIKEDIVPSVLSYLSYCLIHTLHYQVAPQCLMHLVKNVKVLPVKEYLMSWSEEHEPVHIEKVYPSEILISKINKAFLSDCKLEMNEIFNGNNTVTFRYNEENITIRHSLSTYEITYLFKMTIFYFTQFIRKGDLTKTLCDNYRLFLISLLYLAKGISDNTILVEECVKSIFTHPTILHYFSPLRHKSDKDIVKSAINLIVIDICSIAIDLCGTHNVRKLFIHFKNKFLMELCKMIEKKEKCEKLKSFDTIVASLEVLQLTPKDVVHLLKKIVKLERGMFVLNDQKNFSVYGHVFPRLLKILNNEAVTFGSREYFELDAEFVKDSCLHLLFLKSNLSENSEWEEWETSLQGYLSNFSNNIAGIETDTFASLLSTKITHTTVNLTSFLIGTNTKFIPIFIEQMTKSEDIRKDNIALAVLGSNLNYKWDENFLQKLKANYETEILFYLCNPKESKSWIEKNVTAICYLIKTTFTLKTCNETCNTILQIGDQLDTVPIHYVQLLRSMYSKCVNMKAESEKFMMNLMQIFLHIISLTLKKESKNVQKLNMLCEALNEAVQRLREKKEDFMFETLNANHSWSQFTRFSLKFGLKKLKDTEEQVPILKTLSTLCDIAYKNDCNDEYAKTLFEMTISHTEFINVMLGSSDAKKHLMELLWILVQKNKSVMTVKHVPVYLAAYNASLSETDQYVLLILQYYERNNINIHEYRPYVWGNAAAIHYSVKGETSTNLWRQPSVSQVLNLLEEDLVHNTIRNFPVDRALKNNVLCVANDTYDPAFYLPLFCFLLFENNVVSCHRVAQSGALALTLAACSSKNSEVRMLAYTVIVRYYGHLEASRSKARLLWMRLIDATRYGITSSQTELDNVRLNCFVSTFLARTSLIATQPLHPLYPALQTFLMAKPALDINTIPELLHLFHNSDVQHKAHRSWILENIRDGMKTENELDVAFKCGLFKMFFDFYISILSDSNTKKLILEIIHVALGITKASILLMECHGLLPWLLKVAGNPEHEKHHIELIVKIIDKLLNTILSAKGDIGPYKLMLSNVAFRLKPHLVKDMDFSVFTL